MSGAGVAGRDGRGGVVAGWRAVPSAGVMVGRVGALAVALGIGAAVLAMPGLAAADTRGSGGASGSVDSSGSSRSDDAVGSVVAPVRGARRAAVAEPGAGAVVSGPVVRGRSVPDVGEVVVPDLGVAALPAAAQRPPVGSARAGGSGGAVLPAAATAQVAPVVGTQAVGGGVGVSRPAAATAAVSAGPAGAAESVAPEEVGDSGPVLISAAPVSVTVAGPGGSAPTVFAAAAPKAAVPGWIQKVDDLNQSAVRTIFNSLSNWASTLPVNDLTTWLEGGLLMVRKSLFNQSASVSAYQGVNHPELVTGTIDAIDPEGDAYTIAVVDGPANGTLTLAKTAQANGIGTTNYTYTPGAAYSGADQFTVKVSPTSPVFNLMHPFGVLDDRYYTVTVGTAAATDTALGASAKDTIDTSLYMDHAGATVTVTKQGLLAPKYIAAVTLSAASAKRAFDWMDTRGRMGSVSVSDILGKDWSAYKAKAAENGVTPMLVFNYTDPQGADTAVLVDVTKVAKNTDGSYTFTGQLSTDAPAQEGPVDKWDYTGIDYKRAYENFLNTSGLKDCQSGAQCITVSAVGILAATTMSPSSFTQAGGHDYKLPAPPTPGDASATQTSPGSMGPGTTGVNQGNGTASTGSTGTGDTLLTAMIPYGTDGSFITATNLSQSSTTNNGVYLYTASAPSGSAPTWSPAQLIGNGWNASVNAMTSYDQDLATMSGDDVQVTVNGSLTNSSSYTFTGTISQSGTTPATFTGSIEGNTLTVTDVASGTISTGDYVVGGPAANTYIESFDSGTSGGAGTYTVTPNQTLASSALTSGQGGYSLQLAIPGVDPSSLVGAAVTGSEVAPGTVITGYSGIDGDTATYTVNTYNLVGSEPITVTTNSTLLTLAIGTGVNPGNLIGQTITGDGIAANTTITGFVGESSGGNAIYTVNNAVSAPTGNIVVTLGNTWQVQPGIVVGLSDGSVQYWNGNTCSQSAQNCSLSQGWTQLQPSGDSDGGWGSGVAVNTVVSPYQNTLYVGLSNGDVYSWGGQILPDGTLGGNQWLLQNPGNSGSAVTAMAPVDGVKGVIVGYADGSVQEMLGGSYVSSLVSVGANAVQALIPYDQTTLVGAISGAPVVANNGVISEPSYASAVLAASPALQASTSSCESSYNSGSGTGCGGFVLTVQSVAGNPLEVGQTLFGGAGLAPDTVITQQISDDSGNLCSSSCNFGGAGVYLVNASQLVAPGTPMSAAGQWGGTIVGLADGSVYQVTGMLGNGIPETTTQLQDSAWGSPVNTMIPWRDGVVVSLNNGATFYWSPSNNPGNNNPNNPNALTYAGSTVPSQNTQAAGWSQIQGTAWDNAATSLIQVGDGFAVGLTAPSSTKNGGIALFTGFGPASSTSAFGYQQGANGPEALTPSNTLNSNLASQTALSGNSPYGSVQQMIPVYGYMTNSSGDLALAETLVVGLTNNGIYAWEGSNQNTSPTSWTTLQPSGTGGKPVLTDTQLQNAWAYGSAANSNTAWGAAGGVGQTYTAANGSTAASGDPVFGLSTNQAWCGSSCSSYGDYSPLVFNEQFGDDGVIYSWGIGGPNNDDVVTDVNLSSVTYGYVFYPNGFIDKFRPSKYSVGMLAALQGGPTVTINDTSASWTQSFTGPQTGVYEPTAVGTFAFNVGFDASMDETVDLTGVTNPVAYAIYTPGLLYTWNVNGYQNQMGMTFSHYADVGYDSDLGGTATITPTVTPYTNASYGLFTPPSTPIIGQWSVFDLGLGYQNPVSFTLSASVNPADVSMSVSSQGFVTATAGFLTDVTKLLTWSNQFQVYSVTDQLFSASV